MRLSADGTMTYASKRRIPSMDWPFKQIKKAKSPQVFTFIKNVESISAELSIFI